MPAKKAPKSRTIASRSVESGKTYFRLEGVIAGTSTDIDNFLNTLGYTGEDYALEYKIDANPITKDEFKKVTG